jgi:hypothetical protein
MSRRIEYIRPRKAIFRFRENVGRKFAGRINRGKSFEVHS